MLKIKIYSIFLLCLLLPIVSLLTPKKIILNNNDYCNYIKNDTIVKLYQKIVFNNAYCSEYKPVKTKQWNSNLIVYLDKSIPKNIRKEFLIFYQNMNSVNNLKITFTKNKKKANYIILNTSEDLVEKMNLSDKDEKHPYMHVYYNLLTDRNSKFYGGTLSINIEALTDKSLALNKLKQLFFISLGQFTIDKTVKDNSLLSYSYNSNESEISREDLLLLKLHYIEIHKKPLNCISFSRYAKKMKSKCLE